MLRHYFRHDAADYYAVCQLSSFLFAEAERHVALRRFDYGASLILIIFELLYFISIVFFISPP